ncbi:hypothetical protein AAVH_04987 [Aphelenchoides avenae]|nr:hypothetical protein AAVH_04987 [Aphelenchus avenae]
MTAKPPARAAQRSVVPCSKPVGDFTVDVTREDFLADRVVLAVKEKEVFAEIKLYDWSCRPVISVHGTDSERSFNINLEVRSGNRVVLATKADNMEHLFILEQCKKFQIVVTHLAGGKAPLTPTAAFDAHKNVTGHNKENDDSRAQMSGTKASASSKRPPRGHGPTAQQRKSAK